MHCLVVRVFHDILAKCIVVHLPVSRLSIVRHGEVQTTPSKPNLLQSDWGREWLPKQTTGLQSIAASRHLYETVLRKFVLSISNLQVQTAAVVEGLEYNADLMRVTGMWCLARGRSEVHDCACVRI